MDGQFIRKFTQNEGALPIEERSNPDLVWDLKNRYGKDIASGMYLIHVDAKDIGERDLKFFTFLD